MEKPERQVDTAMSVVWTAASAVRAMPGSQDKADLAARFSKELREASETVSAILRAEILRVYDTEQLSFGQVAKRFGISKTRAAQIIGTRSRALTDEEEEAVTEPSTNPEPEPVVAAIVTSHLGVLVGRRNDGKPPWTFIAGEIEPGESPADAAVREVKEEAGLEVRAGGIIGRRVHPRTGRTMVYMAATVVRGTDAVVGDPEELAEVRWASPAEADQLMGGTIFEPVRTHLRRVIGNGSTGK